MKLGVIFCLYGNQDYIEPCLKKWFDSDSNKHQIITAACHHRFKEYITEENKNNTDWAFYNIIREYPFDFIFSEALYPPDHQIPLLSEAEVRDECLQYLLEKNVDAVILVDLDERWTSEQIENVLNYISRQDNQLYSWFSINYKNYIFDGKQWIDGFCPPRVFRTSFNGLKLSKFYWDNDLLYVDYNGNEVNYKSLPNKQVPKNLCHITHLTWLHVNGKEKVQYQLAHFNGGCSYKWNEETQKLEFNKDFYLKNNMPLPIIQHDSISN